jgi:hypothetical protein
LHSCTVPRNLLHFIFYSTSPIINLLRAVNFFLPLLSYSAFNLFGITFNTELASAPCVENNFYIFIFNNCFFVCELKKELSRERNDERERENFVLSLTHQTFLVYPSLLRAFLWSESGTRYFINYLASAARDVEKKTWWNAKKGSTKKIFLLWNFVIARSHLTFLGVDN